MLRSMTGFGAGEVENESCRFYVEIKAVNQRFLDIDMRMPHVLAAYEEDIKKKIREYASRGKLSVSIQFTDRRERGKTIRIDKSMLNAYYKALNEVSDELSLNRPTDVFRLAMLPGVMNVEDVDAALDELKPYLLQAVEEAMQRFRKMREVEGANMAADFLARLEVLDGYVNEIEVLGPEIVERYRERLNKTLTDLLSAQEIDQNRIIQETAIYTDRVNYTEEIVRLRSHFQQFREIISEAAEPVGRKLDFLVQEMNREINTTASKANNTGAARIAVEVKSEIEKVREQVQNIE